MSESVASRTGKRTVRAAAIAAALLAMAGTSTAQDAAPIVGTATVVDSDGLRVGDKSIMLWGIESMERPQTCIIDGQIWQCYAAAVRALETIALVGEVTCQPVGQPDPYGRILATCFVGDVNINEALVRAGFALAKRDETLDYVAAEDAAKAEGIGLWQGTFMLPADFRHLHAIFADRP
jgi:endonuclease YncB( thermonuclease family)